MKSMEYIETYGLSRSWYKHLKNMKKFKTEKEVSDESIDKWIQSFSKTDLKAKKVSRRRKRSTTTNEPKVFGEQPEIVPENQLNLFL